MHPTTTQRWLPRLTPLFQGNQAQGHTAARCRQWWCQILPWLPPSWKCQSGRLGWAWWGPARSAGTLPSTMDGPTIRSPIWRTYTVPMDPGWSLGHYRGMIGRVVSKSTATRNISATAASKEEEKQRQQQHYNLFKSLFWKQAEEEEMWNLCKAENFSHYAINLP